MAGDDAGVATGCAMIGDGRNRGTGTDAAAAGARPATAKPPPTSTIRPARRRPRRTLNSRIKVPPSPERYPADHGESKTACALLMEPNWLPGVSTGLR